MGASAAMHGWRAASASRCSSVIVSSRSSGDTVGDTTLAGCGGARSAATRKSDFCRTYLANGENIIYNVLIYWWVNKDSNLGPAD